MIFGNDHTVFIENLEYSTEYRITQKNQRNLKMRQEQHLRQFERPCLHDQCLDCYGTGIRRGGGICVHGLVCSCPKCSVQC